MDRHGRGPAGRLPQHHSERPRGAPPEFTGAETNYLHKNMEAKTTMVVHLVTNEQVKGVIEYYDRDMIKISRDEPPHLFIRKENIKYLHKDEDIAERQARRDSEPPRFDD